MTKVWTQDMAVLWTVTLQSNAFGLQVSIPGLTDNDHEQDRKRPRRDDWAQPSRSSSPNEGFRQGAGGRNQQQNNQQGDLPSSQLQRWMLCDAFNSKRGCAHKGSACPHQKQHRCSYVAPRGI